MSRAGASTYSRKRSSRNPFDPHGPKTDIPYIQPEKTAAEILRERYYPEFYSACSSGDLDTIRNLISHKRCVISYNDYKSMQIAISANQLPVIQAIFDEFGFRAVSTGAKFNITQRSLYEAISNLKFEIVSYFLENGAVIRPELH